MFAVDESMIHTWALGWAVKALYHPGDQVHLVHVAKRRTDDIQRFRNISRTCVLAFFFYGCILCRVHAK